MGTVKGGTHLEHVVLHHIPDDAVLIKVASPALCAKGLLETNLQRKLLIRHCLGESGLQTETSAHT